MKIGTRVILTKDFKRNCNEHTRDHVEEFGRSIGTIVEKGPVYESWPEVQVEWAGGLKYLYLIKDLEEVK
jgi:hypothetical protein